MSTAEPLPPICADCEQHADGSFTCDPKRSNCPMGAWAPCGDDCHTMTEAHPAAEQCSHCKPRGCDTCGGVNDLATDTMCACWTDLTTMAPADVKALFVADGWNVDTDGRLTR